MNKLRTLLQPDNLPYVPLAAVGLAIGVAEYIIHPFIEDTAHRVGKTVMAHIEYYRSPDK